jgi:hypothetical protein
MLLGLFLLGMPLVLPAVADAQVSVTHRCDTATTSDSCERWYTAGAVALKWDYSALGTPTSGCQNGTFTAEGIVERSCRVSWSGGPVIEEPVWIGIDRTPPQLVGLQPDRPPDYNGWYNHPVGLGFRAADATSGVASCSATSYGGPDGAAVPIGGSCHDVAGNVGAGAFPIYYDATSPATPDVEAVPRNRRVLLRWSSAPDTVARVVRIGPSGRRTLVFLGAGGEFTDRKLRNGRRYRYAITLIDQAGNQAADGTRAVPTGSSLFSPVRGAHLRDAPLLEWKPVRKARYYNVQLVRHGVKVLSRWPRVAKLKLRRSWSYAGSRHRLAADKYCWRVWPGFGDLSKRRYGKLLGESCFRVVR